MGILDWFRSGEDDDRPPELSRRDFFAKFAGGSGSEQEKPTSEAGVLHRFHVSGFPFHDGPVLVPVLRPGMQFDLLPEHGHPSDPDAVRIQWKRDHLGYVPAEISKEIRGKLQEGVGLSCRAARISPNAELAKVLEVEIVQPPEGDDDAPRLEG